MKDIYDIDYDKSLCFTGHRPAQLASYDYKHPDNLKMLRKLKAIIIRLIEKRGIHTFISGMALGIDMWAAQIILALKKKYPHIKLICAIPCAKQYNKWRADDVEIYKGILKEANLIHYVSKEPYSNWCMAKRNEWMVDYSKFIVAVWNGDENGGTWNTIKYAKKRQRPIIHLHPNSCDVNYVS